MPVAYVLVGIGVAAGYFAGFLGAGGGFATVVLLIASGVDAHQAVGTSLVFTLVVGLWGTVLHLRQGTADARLALALGLPSAATALLGAQIAEGFSERTLTMLFGILTGSIAVWMMRPLRERAPKVIVLDEPAPGPGAVLVASRTQVVSLRGRRLAVAVAGGAVIGILKGLFGVGGGFLLMPYMLIVLKIPENVAVGSSLFAILLGSAAAGLRHASLGNVATEGLWYLLPAGVAAALVGTRLSKSASPAVIRLVFIALLLAATAYLLVKSL